MAQMAPTKPGVRTSEFWMQLAAVALNITIASDFIPTDTVWAKIALIAATTLTTLGYTHSRTRAKNGG